MNLSNTLRPQTLLLLFVEFRGTNDLATSEEEREGKREKGEIIIIIIEH